MMERLRRTMMFVPGNNPGMMADAHIYGPDSIMLDLEDSVTMAEKDAARLLHLQGLTEEAMQSTYVLPIGISIMREEKEKFDKTINDYVRENKRNS